jgi:hypothetical protein
MFLRQKRNFGELCRIHAKVRNFHVGAQLPMLVGQHITEIKDGRLAPASHPQGWDFSFGAMVREG